MVGARGEIWWANLREPIGYEPGFWRPVLVVQADIFNRSRVQTVIAVILKGNLERATLPGKAMGSLALSLVAFDALPTFGNIACYAVPQRL